MNSSNLTILFDEFIIIDFDQLLNILKMKLINYFVQHIFVYCIFEAFMKTILYF